MTSPTARHGVDSALPPALERALDLAIALPARQLNERVERLRRDHPDAGTEELVWWAGERLRRESALTSAAVGASAALPAVGTGSAAALTVGQTAAFLTSAVTYILTVAELRGLHLTSPERRRTLVLAALLGQQGVEAVQGALGLSALYWASQTLAQMPLSTARSVNQQLARHLARRQARRAGALSLGRLAPFGIGAAIGWVGGRSLAAQVIEGAQAALAPASHTGEERTGSGSTAAPDAATAAAPDAATAATSPAGVTA